MAKDAKHRVCPVEKAGSLDTRFRRWLQNPHRILRPFVRQGMTVLDFGCGPGFFSIPMAQLVGQTGHVMAVDLQSGMLEKLKGKVQGSPLEKIIRCHQCEKDELGVSIPVDFVLAFYVVHEVPDKVRLFQQIAAVLKSKKHLLIVEPPFHVSKSAFENCLTLACEAGFEVESQRRMLLSKAAVLTRK